MFHVFFVLNRVNVVISQIEMSFEHVFIFHDGCDFLDRFGKLKDCYIIGPCHAWRLLLMQRGEAQTMAILLQEGIVYLACFWFCVKYMNQ